MEESTILRPMSSAKGKWNDWLSLSSDCDDDSLEVVQLELVRANDSYCEITEIEVRRLVEH
jgi:hypothetical protein